LKKFIKEVIMPPGPVLSVALIGLMLLSGYLYYKAVRFQRFLEPTLALTQPVSQFDQRVIGMIKGEFGPEDADNIRYSMGSMRVRESVLVAGAHQPGGSAMFGKLARVFKKMLDDPELKSSIKVILVSKTAKLGADPVLSQYNRTVRHEAQDQAEGILNTLYSIEPELETKYGSYFEATAIPAYRPDAEAGWVAFRIVPSERLHIEVLQKLEKYID